MPAPEEVLAIAANKCIVAALTPHKVIAASAADEVGAIAPVELVVKAVTQQPVVEASAAEVARIKYEVRVAIWVGYAIPKILRHVISRRLNCLKVLRSCIVLYRLHSSVYNRSHKIIYISVIGVSLTWVYT